MATEWEAYRSGDVHIQLPYAWINTMHQAGTGLVSLLITSECPPKQCLIMVIQAHEKHVLNHSSAEKYTQDIRNKSVSFSMGKPEPKTLDGNEAMRFAYTAKFARITLEYITYMVSVDTKTYFITLSTPEKNLPRFQADFEKIVQSLRFDAT